MHRVEPHPRRSIPGASPPGQVKRGIRSVLRRAFAPMVAVTAVVIGVSPTLATSYSTSGLVDTTGISPFRACTADNAASQSSTFGSVNYPNSEVEPWLDVNPRDPRNIVGGYQQDRWSDGGSRGDVTSVSHDGGLTWTQVTLPGVTKCEGGAFDRASDPWLSFGPDGTLWFVALAFDVFQGRTGMIVSKSADGGSTWSAPVDVAPNAVDPPRFPFDDKESLTADPNHAGNVYVVFDQGLIPPSWTMPHNPSFPFWGSSQPTLLARTTDGGQTWEAPRVIYNPGANDFTTFNQIVALPSGTLVDSLFEFLARKDNAGGGQFSAYFSVLRSPDQGVHWSAVPVRVAQLVDTGLSDVPVPLRVGGQALAVDRNPASPGYGNLYAVWLDGRFSNGQYGDIAFSMSRDGGITWSTPTRANLTPRGHSAFTPSVAVAADGTVGVGYYDVRNYAGSGPILTDLWLSHCHPSDVCTQTSSWSETHVAGPFDMSGAPDSGGLFLGDYAGLGVSGSHFLPYYATSSAGDPADVWFAHVGP